jgi:hypothetical protein
MAEHDHEHDHGEEENGDHQHGPPGFEDVVQWLAEQSRVALEEEGEHASVVFLGLPDGNVRAQRFDATGQHDVADAWGRVATWAKGVGANAVYFVAEAKRAHEDEADERPESEEDVLLFAALNAEGEEASYVTPFERGDAGKISLGETEPSDSVAVPFNEFRELWGLPLIAGAADAPPEH